MIGIIQGRLAEYRWLSYAQKVMKHLPLCPPSSVSKQGRSNHFDVVRTFLRKTDDPHQPRRSTSTILMMRSMLEFAAPREPTFLEPLPTIRSSGSYRAIDTFHIERLHSNEAPSGRSKIAWSHSSMMAKKSLPRLWLGRHLPAGERHFNTTANPLKTIFRCGKQRLQGYQRIEIWQQYLRPIWLTGTQPSITAFFQLVYDEGRHRHITCWQSRAKDSANDTLSPFARASESRRIPVRLGGPENGYTE